MKANTVTLSKHRSALVSIRIRKEKTPMILVYVKTSLLRNKWSDFSTKRTKLRHLELVLVIHTPSLQLPESTLMAFLNIWIFNQNIFTFHPNTTKVCQNICNCSSSSNVSLSRLFIPLLILHCSKNNFLFQKVTHHVGGKPSVTQHSQWTTIKTLLLVKKLP
jgi:hypothetical protein